MPKISTRDRQAMADAISESRDFECHGAVKGKAGDPNGVGYELGMLGGDMLDQFRRDVNAGTVDYVVYSYATPMAWHTPFGWEVNRNKYSVTTSRHQGAIGAAIGRASGEF